VNEVIEFVSDDTQKSVVDDPTEVTYGALREAFDYFNARLFEGRLPRCLLTPRTHAGAFGYYSPKRFGDADGNSTDEIAINHSFVLVRPLPEVLSTLVHEMVHMAQEHFGKACRRGYHDRQWGNGMKAIGLYPSSTGLPGGRETGQRVSHYIVPGGLFEVACRDLLAGGFTLRYGDVRRPAERAKRDRVRFTCPGCELHAWAKPSASLICGTCMQVMAGGSFVSDDALEAAA
jgi:ribosomal protein L37AE/L43A